MNMDLPELVQALRDILGAKLVAYIGAVQETRAVRQWADDVRRPSQTVENRLRETYQIAQTLRERDAAVVVQAWFQGMNPFLDDQAPAKVLRESETDDSARLVLAAAKAFSSSNVA
jgi:hypothetical protein